VGSREDAVAESDAARELGVGAQNTAVNDISVCAGTSRGVVNIAGRARGTVGDRSQTPRSAALGGDGTVLKLGLALFKVEVLNKIRLNSGDLKDY
jgi:hypothetical protein